MAYVIDGVVDMGGTSIVVPEGGRAEGIELFAYAAMDENDRIEVWIENQTASRNVTAEVGGLFGITERPS